MNTNTSNKSIWDLYKENFLCDLWDFGAFEKPKTQLGYSVHPELLKGL